MDLSPYRKLIVAAVALVLLAGKQFLHWNIDDGAADQIVNAIIVLGGLIAIHQTPNAK
jgi:hypothetical protein